MNMENGSQVCGMIMISCTVAVWIIMKMLTSPSFKIVSAIT